MVWVRPPHYSHCRPDWAWPCGKEETIETSSSAFVGSRFVPQGEFYPVAYSNLVVDRAEVISDHVLANPQFHSDFAILQSLGHQFDHSDLASAELPRPVSVDQPLLN